ncbi:hypothetical protein MMC29_000920 [Sticta canariensis]|nr:hypothetical protein [Sticta canariensis]
MKCFSFSLPEADSIFTAWHDHRLFILFICFVSTLILRLSLRRRFGKERLSGSPLPRSPIVGKTTWLNEKEQQSLPAKIHGGQELEKLQDSSGDARVLVPAQAFKSPRLVPKKVIRSESRRQFAPRESPIEQIQPLVFFSSLTGSTQVYATKFVEDLKSSLKGQSSTILDPFMHDLSYIDYDDFFITPPKSTPAAQDRRYFYLLLLPTYNIDTVLNLFLTHLQETHHDFRIDTAPLSSLIGYSVFGFGDREGWNTEEEGFCSQAIEVDKWMAKLTARKRAFPLGLGDVKSDVQQRLEEWSNGVSKALMDIVAQGGLGEGVVGSGDAVESDEEEIDESPKSKFKDAFGNKQKRFQSTSRVDDLEDLGGTVRKDKVNLTSEPNEPSSFLPIDLTTSGKTSRTSPDLKEMVPLSSPTHAALTKQGYTIIGSHSGVKICRWTKSALRGRGSCYKYSFYGIKSHLCMETTPSLSCSNKCVFCWRHGTNPVGTVWRWKTDPPDFIFVGAKEAHLKKIKMMRGVPGVRAERFQEAMTIRHCALSLVGEPIFYPHINEFLALLHADRISSFLVCNAQHPEQLEALGPVTQLYVSIDASNKESLRKIDRPLHRDFWQRFLACLEIIRAKRFRMRTVFRLTLVKGFNIADEAEGYADLVARGLPCFVEVKGVTYCGTSSSGGAGITMQNVPFYAEVVAFVEALDAALARRGLDYGIAAEHAHSCCVLLASKRFLVQGQWRTLIDYDRFFDLLRIGEPFGPDDYMGAPTPEWAMWGNGGFDPVDERVYRRGKNKAVAGMGSACEVPVEDK